MLYARQTIWHARDMLPRKPSALEGGNGPQPGRPMHRGERFLPFIGCAGTVNGVQSSLQNALQALSFAAGLVLWRPEQFVWLMLGSLVSVGMAAALYARYAVCAKARR